MASTGPLEAPTSNLSWTSLVPRGDGCEDGLGVVVERGASGELVSVDVDDDGVDPSQGPHDLALPDPECVTGVRR